MKRHSKKSASLAMKKKLMLISTVLIGISFLFSFIWLRQSQINKQTVIPVVQKQEKRSEKPSTQIKEKQGSLSKNTQMFVDVKGAVAKPGMYSVTDNMRVQEVILKAGNFLPEADQTYVNLAQKVTDQLVIYVPKKGEETSLTQVTVSATTSKEGSSQSDQKQLININQADVAGLQQLTGIGGKKAEEIVRYREEQGEFQKIEDLKKVSGIGEKTFESLKEWITIE